VLLAVDLGDQRRLGGQLLGVLPAADGDRIGRPYLAKGDLVAVVAGERIGASPIDARR
jgi:hypothetical protein